MLKKVKLPIHYFSYRRAIAILYIATCSILHTGCKDNEKIAPGGADPDPTAIIPSKGKKYTYRITEVDGAISSEVIRVRNTSDSAGISVSYIETLTKSGQDETTLNWKAYSKDGITTNEIALPAAFTGLLEQFKELGTIKDVRITGFPQSQQLENKAVVGSKMTFKGGDIKLYIKLDMPGEEGENIVVELKSTLTFDDGQLVKVEDITTPAGKFTCSKWEYGYTNITELFYNGQEGEQFNEQCQITTWTTPGVGVVKSIDNFLLEESVTELQKIE